MYFSLASPVMDCKQQLFYFQDGTEESISLGNRELTFYSWLTQNDLCHQKLRLCLDGESRWCEAFVIDSTGVVNRAIQYGVHTATLIIEVKKKSGLQREVLLLLLTLFVIIIVVVVVVDIVIIFLLTITVTIQFPELKI